ncbi:hypothetical protein Taro_018138, partial [Colocasia esculenta]|nr:hypothetical protein [Colocasia esculenta]
ARRRLLNRHGAGPLWTGLGPVESRFKPNPPSASSLSSPSPTTLGPLARALPTNASAVAVCRRAQLNEMAPTLKRRNRKHLQPEEEGSEDEEVTSSEEEEEEEVLSEDESEEADSEHDMKEDGDSDDVEGTDDEDVNEAEGIGGPRQNVSRGGEELEELEKEYQSLQQQEQSLLSNLRHQRDEDRLKGQAIKNQKALWNKNLEFRFLLQKAFAKSNRLPQEPLRSKFHDYDKTVENAYSELILTSEKTLNSMLQLQEALLEKNTSISQDNYVASNKLEVGNDDKWFQIQSMQCRIAPFRNSSIDKWQRKTQVTSGAAAIKSKLHAFNQNISDQVAAYMRDPSRMIGRMQLKRSAVGILGESPEEIVTESKEDGNVELANVDGDPELIDDSEFYQQLLKEFFESFDIASEPAYSALRKSQTRKRKTVDRRASKSRKIRYSVHEKIVNFMAPLPMVLPPMAPKLFENLFGLQKKESTFNL